MPNRISTMQAVYNKDATQKVVAVSGGYRCRLSGCTGSRLPVIWPDGTKTRPCTKGLFTRPDGDLQIG